MKIVKFEAPKPTDDDGTIAARKKNLSSIEELRKLVAAGKIEAIAFTAVAKNGDVHTWFGWEPVDKDTGGGSFKMLGAIEYLKARYMKTTIQSDD